MLPKQIQHQKRVCNGGNEEGGRHLSHFQNLLRMEYSTIEIFSFKYYLGKHFQNRGPRGLWYWQVCQVPDLPVGFDRKAGDVKGGPDDLKHLHPLCGHLHGGDGLGHHARAQATVSQAGPDRGSVHILVHNWVPAQVHFATFHLAPSGYLVNRICCPGLRVRHKNVTSSRAPWTSLMCLLFSHTISTSSCLQVQTKF